VLQIGVTATELEAGIARDYRERPPGRKTCDQILRQTIGEESLLRVGREIVEWQYRDSRPLVQFYCLAAGSGGPGLGR
jgi:hypothetical protein